MPRAKIKGRLTLTVSEVYLFCLNETVAWRKLHQSVLNVVKLFQKLQFFHRFVCGKIAQNTSTTFPSRHWAQSLLNPNSLPHAECVFHNVLRQKFKENVIYTVFLLKVLISHGLPWVIYSFFLQFYNQKKHCKL